MTRSNDQGPMVVEAFHLSKQTLTLYKDCNTSFTPFNSTHIQIHSSKSIQIGSQTMKEIDCNFFAVPLAIESLEKQAQRYRGKTKENIPAISFQSVFPSPRQLLMASDDPFGSHQQQKESKVRKIANDYMMKILRRLGNASHGKQPSPLDIDTMNRLQDLHLLEYLRKYFSASTFSSLCMYLADYRRHYHHHPARSLEDDEMTEFQNQPLAVPMNVQMEAKLLFQSFSSDFDDDL